MVSDKTINKAFRIHKTLSTKAMIREISYFHYLPKLDFGFKLNVTLLQLIQ